MPLRLCTLQDRTISDHLPGRRVLDPVPWACQCFASACNSSLARVPALVRTQNPRNRKSLLGRPGPVLLAAESHGHCHAGYISCESPSFPYPRYLVASSCPPHPVSLFLLCLRLRGALGLDHGLDITSLQSCLRFFPYFPAVFLRQLARTSRSQPATSSSAVLNAHFCSPRRSLYALCFSSAQKEKTAISLPRLRLGSLRAVAWVSK
ncbi:hypothetical protein BD289DRAFT_233887 [Coniella lustricola]|uniref:Uncharacterized protein n=1 Tax=Coniella lustricola TaxID=2025994 RepID=A0A2T3AA26_9PEZI|nr:hypothetical protein BD289DRAFT_233887 [Coniella lustricola]